MIKKRIGILFEAEIIGTARELPDIGYPIPDYQQNVYELERLFTESFETELRIKKRENDDTY